ncbi:MDR family MFS transporter [Aspergillus saccharolyticus JOP 1030-1]|uniref:Putative MFS multidrug transporter n=1 Tax=Aspergillus saccharolyticus JOP 1030-1 TaxID=1450539 RepID=A0A318Z6F7_9EURO|nr:putative MFS multidrug transporter [Aspergillus saccharolyticus JOP 1030-1]PYH42865.1 putative MFS multidrug transporter [Aspergillus saccharolyticus JOP 1030-1]
MKLPTGSEAQEVVGDEFHITRPQALTITAMMVLSLMAALDGSLLAVALPVIANDLHASAIQGFWAGTSYLLCSAVFQPIFGSLSEALGRKALVLFGMVIFALGALVAGIAHNVTQLLVGRSLQGVGGGGLITLSSIIIADYIPLKARGRYLGMLSAVWAVGSVIGPVIGGCFAEKSTWRWIFYINFPFIGIGAALLLVFFPRASASCHPRDWRAKLREIDLVGMVLFAASTSSFLIPLSWGGVMYRWSSWHTLLPLCLGVGGLLAFGGYEYRWARQPVIPPTIFRDRSTSIALGSFFCLGFLLWCGLYYLSLYYQIVKGYTPIVTGVALFPATLTIAPVAAVTGFAIAATGRIRWAIWAGWILATVGFGLLCLLQVETPIPGWVFIEMVSGIGLGMVVLGAALAVQTSSPPELVPLAISLATFFRSFGQCVGVAIGGVIFQNRATALLARHPHLRAIAQRYRQDPFGLIPALERADAATRGEVRSVYADSLRTIWAMGCALSGVALMASLWMKSRALR